jgi:hypothetical protein
MTGIKAAFSGRVVQSCLFCSISPLLFSLALPLPAMNNKGRNSEESGKPGSIELAKGFLSTAPIAVRLF